MIKNFLFLFIGLSQLAFGQNKKNIELLGTWDYKMSRLSNIWGYVDSAGNEYALVGLVGFDNNENSVCDCAMAVVDLKNPAQPKTTAIVNGPNSTWREIRTYKNYAYITTEAGGGITITDLSKLPTSVQSYQYTGDGEILGQLDRVHALQIDDHFLYLYGGNLSNGGIKIFDIIDPTKPKYLGAYDIKYVHDGYVRNNIAYAGQIYDGSVAIIDMANKAAPKLLGEFYTPGKFTHNTWLSKDSKTLFTTDEVDASYVGSFDVSDFTNVKELDRYQRQPNDSSVVHNTYVLNDSIITGFNTDFVWTSYYTQGVSVVDAKDPKNMVEVGYYDGSTFEGKGYKGVWGVYPYLPSGTILISDREGKMDVLKSKYVAAARLQGKITNAANSAPIANVSVTIVGQDPHKNSLSDGNYFIGLADSGFYSVRFYKQGFNVKVVDGVKFSNGKITNLDVTLNVGTIGINAMENSYINIYPNPSSGSVHVNLNHQFGTLKIYNLLGVEIYSKDCSDENILKIELPKGVYSFVFVDEKNNKSIQKLIVN